MSLLIYASQFSTIRTLSTSHSKCNKCFMTLLSNFLYAVRYGTDLCGKNPKECLVNSEEKNKHFLLSVD